MVSEEDLIRTVSTAYGNGWRQVKLYFMCGLPTETDEDVLQIADMAMNVIAEGRKVSGQNDIRCTVSIGGFVPKPHTPFQWAPQLSAEETDARLTKLRDKIRGDKKYGRSIGFRYHDGKPGIVEGLLSRGDRRIGAVIRAVYEDGGRFDGWREHFSYDRWMRCAEKTLPAFGVDVDWYTTREKTYEEVLPWDHLDSRVSTRTGSGRTGRTPSTRPRSRTAGGHRASTAGSARRWTPRSRSARRARSCCR